MASSTFWLFATKLLTKAPAAIAPPMPIANLAGFKKAEVIPALTAAAFSWSTSNDILPINLTKEKAAIPPKIPAATRVFATKDATKSSTGAKAAPTSPIIPCIFSNVAANFSPADWDCSC